MFKFFRRLFENPFRLIHEVYVYKVWSREYRKQHPEFKIAYDRNSRNLDTLIIQLYVAFFVAVVMAAIIVFVVGNYEIVKTVSVPAGLEV